MVYANFSADIHQLKYMLKLELTQEINLLILLHYTSSFSSVRRQIPKPWSVKSPTYLFQRPNISMNPMELWWRKMPSHQRRQRWLQPNDGQKLVVSFWFPILQLLASFWFSYRGIHGCHFCIVFCPKRIIVCPSAQKPNNLSQGLLGI